MDGILQSLAAQRFPPSILPYIFKRGWTDGLHLTPHQVDTFLAVARWQASVTPLRPIRLRDLKATIPADDATIALALKLKGWTRDPVRTTRNNRRQLQTWWVPPGNRIKRRRRGRPSFADLLYIREER